MPSQKHNEDLAQKALDVTSITRGFDELADHVVVTDPNGVIIYANQAAATQTGFAQHEMIGKKPGDLWGGHMGPEVYEEMWHTIKELKKAWHGEVRNKRKDGTEYWQELRVNPVLDDEDEIVFFVAIEPNITERKNAEQTLLRSLAATEAMNTFLAGREIKLIELQEMVDALQQEIADYREVENLDPSEHD
jgi:PAS domain S-box-containing protein